MKDPQADLPAGSEWPRDPYKGLNYFSAADEPLFGQRELEIDDMIFLLSSFDTRAVLFHGGTGTGKSSFLRAGLCPRLQRMPVEDGRRFFFLRESRSDGSGDDPLLIRATDDPVARIYDELRKVAAAESNDVSDSVRQTLRQLLPEPVPRDRLNALPAILAALKTLTAPPQRETFVLLVDQAEEVLTLPTTVVAENIRSAFFALIEQICFRSRSMDLRLIVTLRTEYYGRFCSFFRIRPTNKLTPDTEVGAGLFDYLLRPLSGPDVAAAIRQPTSGEPRDDRLRPPRSVYGFSYRGELPEMIAADLLRQSGEASTLPAMQIVCRQLYERVVVKGGRAEITEEDYKRFGRAEGAIDAFMERALRDAAGAANLPPLGETDIDTWALVLWHVVGRTEGGTVQTLIASERDLLTEAESRGIVADAARAMLNQMVDPQRRLLRLAGGEGGTSAYSLGHDSLGPSVLRRSGEAAVRAEAEKKQDAERAVAEALLARERDDQRVRDERYRSRLKLARVALFILLVLAAGGPIASNLIFQRERLASLTLYADREQSSDFRLRILLLAAALQISDTWPSSWFLSPEPSRKVLRGVLLRSPIFGGTFDAAAWDYDGRRVVRLENDKLIVHDLSTAEDSKPSAFPPASIGIPGTTSVGLTELKDGAGPLVAFRSTTAIPLVGEEGSTLTERSFDFPKELSEPGLFIARAEIFNKHLRVVVLHFSGSTIDQMRVLNLSGSAGSSFKASNQNGDKIDWRPTLLRAVRQPVLAEDCDTYAFIGRAEPPRAEPPGDDKRNQQESQFTLWLGQLGEEHAHPTKLQGNPIAGAVAISRGCDWIVVRDDSNLNLHVVPLNKDRARFRPRTVQLNLEEEDGIVGLPNTPQAQPMFAAAPLSEGRGLRVGWATAKGLAFVDLKPGENGVAKLLLQRQMFTGVQSSYGLGSLSLSPDGSSALMTRQLNFGAEVQTRVFSLDVDARRSYLSGLKTTGALVREACRIAKFQTGSNELSPEELEIWLGARNALQPCTGNK